MIRRTLIRLVTGGLALSFLASALPARAARPIRVKLGTVAPEGSPWFDTVARIRERWKKASDGQVRMKVYGGGVAGDEEEVLRKIKVGQLHAATITGVGLSQMSRATLALQVPMLMRSYAELDYVRERMKPVLEKELREAGFVVLNWGDAGWVHFFSTEKAVVPEDFRDMRIMVGAKDPDTEAAWKAANFQPVPVSATDVLQGLQTGLLDAFAAPPIFALSSQWFGLATHMVPVKWTPLNGATVVSVERWNRVPEELRAELLEIAEEEGERSKKQIRALGDKALEEMKKRGLTVHSLSAEQQKAWETAAENAYPIVRGKVVPTEVFDQVKALAEEYRKKNP
jgi:TRAP-type transport system periplasmic protein